MLCLCRLRNVFLIGLFTNRIFANCFLNLSSHSMGVVFEDSEKELAGTYEKALQHWTSVSSDVNGMLGGFEKLHLPDISGSRNFLTSLKNSKYLLKNEVALDCGSGIGRVTKHLLLPFFKRVDMIDFADNFIQNSRKYIGENEFRRIGHQFSESLHVFEPNPNTYDLIWVQWVTGHLTDKDFIKFLKRCMIALRNDGCIVIKDNIASGSSKEFDTEDHSWTRSKQDLYSIFRRARAEVLVDRRQLNFPKGIYEVRMFALKPVLKRKGIDYLTSSDSESDDDEIDSNSEDESCIDNKINDESIVSIVKNISLKSEVINQIFDSTLPLSSLQNKIIVQHDYEHFEENDSVNQVSESFNNVKI